MKYNILPKNLFYVDEEELLETNLMNCKLPNPIGLAAGFDKSAEVYNSLFKLGYGFVEVGTVTPKKQLGNPKPRVFRLEKDHALINGLDLIIMDLISYLIEFQRIYQVVF